MATIDYMKVIDIISKIFQADRNVDLTANHDKVDIFDIKAKVADGSEIAYRILLNNYEMDILIKKKYFEKIKFPKWVSTFEYEMEQTFMKNVKIESSEELTDYRIKINM